MQVKIKKAKLIDEGKRIEIEFSKKPEGFKHDAISFEEYSDPVHPDLIKAFENIRVHWAIMGGVIHSSEVAEIKTPDETLLENITLRGYSYGKDDKDPGITLFGSRKMPDGKVVNFNTPFYRLKIADYLFAEDLVEKLNRADEEVKKYLFENKKADDKQLKMFEDKAPIHKIQVDHPANHYDETLTTENVVTNDNIPPADLEARARVAGPENKPKKPAAKPAIKTPPKPPAKKAPTKAEQLKGIKNKKVPQSADAPSGEVAE